MRLKCCRRCRWRVGAGRDREVHGADALLDVVADDVRSSQSNPHAVDQPPLVPRRASMPSNRQPRQSAFTKVGLRKVSSAPGAGGRASDEEVLFKFVLRELEICQENEVMSNASSIASRPRPSYPWNVMRPLEVEQLKDILWRLRLRELPTAAVALQLMRQLRDHLREHCDTLVRLPLPTGQVVVVGDLHGHFNDLLHLLDTHGEPSASNQYLFNGDFIDRGDWGPEVLLSLSCLALLHRDSVHLNRGNHEDPLCNENYGFRAQLMQAFPGHHEELYACIHEAFDQLPLSHVIGDKVFVVHGGIPLEYTTLADIQGVPKGPLVKPAKARADRIREDLLWSDPAEVAGRNDRGSGVYWAEGDTRRFLMSNGLKIIIRSHDCVDDGFRYDHDGHVLTIFSASNYNQVVGGNAACVAIVDADGNVRPGDSWNVPYVKAGWVEELDRPGGDIGDMDGALRSRADAVEEWSADAAADRRAAFALRQRVGDASQWEGSAKERGLDELRRLIFLARPQLLEAFEMADIEKDGGVSVAVWMDVMRSCLRTSKRFPWARLGPYLYGSDHRGCVAYMEFLWRLQSPLAQMLADRWCDAMLVVLAERLNDRVGDEFDVLDKDADGLLTYAELRPLIHEHLPMSGLEAIRQSMHVFALFRALDRHGTGFVARADFVAAVEEAPSSRAYCRQGHRLVEDRLRCCRGHLHIRACDKCSREIQRRDFRLHCNMCDYDLCEQCFATSMGFDAGDLDFLRIKGRPSLGGTRLQREWDRVEAAVCLLCRSRCDLRALCHLADSNADGCIDRAEFVTTVGRILQGDASLAELLWDLAGRHVHGEEAQQRRPEQPLPVADFARCLAVVDVGAARGPGLAG